jgi:hypothetical protein
MFVAFRRREQKNGNPEDRHLVSYRTALQSKAHTAATTSERVEPFAAEFAPGF